ncbi:response regulator transcription factor [Paraclostridium sordellii]|uniref:response regulator transcription factor n=1 Tax=Paraclostridium sordellii TaxID=1505 RepID=UPI002E8DEC37|nr:response regulator transcription factor [Paeniclostridium sordellii]
MDTNMDTNIKIRKILIVDDEVELLNLLKMVLTKEGFENIYTAQNGKDAIDLFENINPDLAILDVMLPDMEGYDICKIIRKTSNIPVLFLSAKGEELNRVMGLAIGADDYITKPFSPMEVALRVKIQLTKYMMINNNTPNNKEILIVKPFEIDEEKMEVRKNGQVIELKPKEYKMFLYMLKHKNQIISKERLYNEVWGEDFFGSENTVMVHIRKLRESIEENPSKPKYLLTVKGLGYKLQIED